MKFDASEPGFLVSGAIHALVLLAALVAFSRTPKFEDTQETAPVDLVTDQQFNQIMKGEKTAKQVLKAPSVRVQQKTDTPDLKPLPPVAEAQRDVPTPPPPLRRVTDPGEDENPPTPPAPVAALPPERPADLSPPPPPQAQSAPPPPDNAEAVDPPLPPQRPRFAQQEKPPPLPPKDRPKVKEKEQDELKPDQIAKLLSHASRPRAQDNPSDSQQRMDPSAIAQLLSRDAPQQRASSDRELSDVASLGSETASAARMSPSMWGALDGLLQDQYKRCWSYLGLDTEHRYVPQIKVEYTEDGALAAMPALLNPPSDPTLRGLADSAMRAVRECNPLKIPPQFAPYFSQWKARILRFDPEEMSG